MFQQKVPFTSSPWCYLCAFLLFQSSFTDFSSANRGRLRESLPTRSTGAGTTLPADHRRRARCRKDKLSASHHRLEVEGGSSQYRGNRCVDNSILSSRKRPRQRANTALETCQEGECRFANPCVLDSHADGARRRLAWLWNKKKKQIHLKQTVRNLLLKHAKDIQHQQVMTYLYQRLPLWARISMRLIPEQRICLR